MKKTIMNDIFHSPVFWVLPATGQQQAHKHACMQPDTSAHLRDGLVAPSLLKRKGGN
jgi:hypothetical protein